MTPSLLCLPGPLGQLLSGEGLEAAASALQARGSSEPPDSRQVGGARAAQSTAWGQELARVGATRPRSDQLGGGF